MAESIRSARSEDVSAVLGIDGSVNRNPWPESRIEVLCESGSADALSSSVDQYLLVAQEAGQVCGFIVVSCLPPDGEIQNLGVDLPSQGRGLGVALVGAALDLLRAQSARRCMLEVRRSNGTARRLYEKSGFTIDGVRKNYYQTGRGREDAILMSLDLATEYERVK